jgi:hypothetical protein
MRARAGEVGAAPGAAGGGEGLGGEVNVADGVDGVRKAADPPDALAAGGTAVTVWGS